MLESSKGRDPQTRAYRMIPLLHTSTSGPRKALIMMEYDYTVAPLGFLVLSDNHKIKHRKAWFKT